MIRMGHSLREGNAPGSASQPACSLWAVGQGAGTERGKHRKKEEGKGEGRPCVKMKWFVEIPLFKKKTVAFRIPASHTFHVLLQLLLAMIRDSL